VNNGHYEQAIQVGRQALVMAEGLGLEKYQIGALSGIGVSRILGGDRGGIANMEQAAAIARQANSPDAAMACGNLGSMWIVQGDLARGFALQTEARRVAERFGLANELRWFRAEQSCQDYWQGQWETALADADQVIAEAEAGTPHFMERTCRLVRGLIRLARGELPGALADAASAVELAGQLRAPDALLPALAFHARTLLANSQDEQAGARAGELLAELAERGALATNPDWSGQLAIVLEALGRGAELDALATTAAMPTPWLTAAIALAAGNNEAAADIYAEIGSLPDEAYARLRAAQQHLAAGRRTEGTAQLRRATAFYRLVRASSYLRQADALIAASA
jgi:hypothetical protein